MTALLLGLLLAAAGPDCPAWDDTAPGPPPPVVAVRAHLAEAAQAAGADCLDRALASLRSRYGLPYAAGDEALVVALGGGEVALAGDATGWQPVPMERVRSTGPGGTERSLWLHTWTLPPDARVDYKLVVDGEWVLDPFNPHQQWGGAGPNSELRMPGWRAATETAPRPDVPGGTWSGPDTLRSAALGEPVVVRVYAPPGVEGRTLRLGARGGAPGALPLVVVTDGHEYADPRLGALPTVLDNLWHEGRLPPLVAVFVDPRWDGQNRRQSHYVDHPGFADFVATELVPAVEAAYPVARRREARALLGTSLGGLAAATLGARHPDVFGALAIQSPAFWVGAGPDAPAPGFTSWRPAWTGPSVYERLSSVAMPLRISMSTGTIRDTEAGARRMRDALRGTPHTLTYREVPEGHSWGQWRGLVGAQLADLFGPPEAE